MTRGAKKKKKKQARGDSPPGAGPRPGALRPAPAAALGMPPVDPAPWLWYGLVMLLIFGAVIGVYWNTLGNEFLTFDDRKYIYENELVTGDGGLGAIWGDLFNEKPRLHYNPMTYSSFWIEHALVGGLEPEGVDPETVMGQAAHPIYHVTQMLLHALNACLVLLVLRALGISFPVAVFTALFFAMHPVNVASVAWVAERKNLVSALFFWAALLLYVHHRRLADRSLAYARGKLPWFYVAALAVFALALLSKAAALVLAPVILITDRLLDRRWSWAAVGRAAPFFLLGLLSAKMVTMREKLIAKSWEPLPHWSRPFIALAALVAYVATMLAPLRQAIIYPRWEVSLANPRYWIAILVVGAFAYLVWRYRRWLGDHWLWGLGLFLLTVAPVLGLVPFIWTQFAFHSDHYMYYGSPGVILMVGLLLERWCRAAADPASPAAAPDRPAWRRGRLYAVAALSLLALVGCGWRVTQQNRTWAHNQALWSHTITVSPDAMIARMNLGNHYNRHGQYELAYEQYKEFARVRPDWSRAWTSSARAAARLSLDAEAESHYLRAIEVAEGKNPRAHSVRKEYADFQRGRGRLREALDQYEIVLEKSPPNAEQVQRLVERLRRQLYSADPPVSSVSP